MSAQTLVGSNSEQGNTDTSTQVKVQILVYERYPFFSSVKTDKYKGSEMYSKYESFHLTWILLHYNNDDDRSFITEH